MGRFRFRAAVPGVIGIIAVLVTGPLPAQQAAETPLPVQRVVLYKSGIGYFEHLG